MKSPNSSVTPCADPDWHFRPWLWQLTATVTPADFEINQMVVVIMKTYMMIIGL